MIKKLLRNIVKRVLRPILDEIEKEKQRVLIYVLPGGRMPERKTDGAIGYDVFARAIVCARQMDPENPVFRKTIFDFKNMPSNPEVASRIVKDEKRGLGYRMTKGESVTIAIGCVTAMPFPMFYWITPRSGLSSREGVTVTNAPGTVDPDYRGEAGVLLYNRDNEHFDVFSDMRVAQNVFQQAIVPIFEEVKNYEDLPKTIRGSGGFGSTGLY